MSNKEKIKPKYFQCYLDNITILEHLSDEEAGQLWKLLYNLAVNDEKGSSGNPLVSMAFDMMANKLEQEFAAYEKKIQSGHTAAAIELEDGTIITSKSSPLLGCCAALLLNAMKYLAGIDHEVKLIPQSMIEPIQKTKIEYLGGKNPRLHTDEVLVALSVLSQHDDNCRHALEQLPKLRDCQVHTTVMLSEVDRKIFKKLGCGLTCDPVRKQ